MPEKIYQTEEEAGSVFDDVIKETPLNIRAAAFNKRLEQLETEVFGENAQAKRKAALVAVYKELVKESKDMAVRLIQILKRDRKM